jgi:hypothetical protein
MTKITFEKSDEPLAAIIRALASKSAGNQIVSGMTDRYLREHGFYRFQFNKIQAERFKGFISKYLAEQFQTTLKIEEDSN